MQLVFVQAWISPKSVRIISLAVLLVTSQYLAFVSDAPRNYLLEPLKSTSHKTATWLSLHISVPRLPTVKLPRWIRNLWRRPPYSHYESPEDEQRYWDTASRWNRCLASSDARLGGSAPPAGRISLRISRSSQRMCRASFPCTANRYMLTRRARSTTSCLTYIVNGIKWCIPPRLPSVRQAERRIKNLSSRDRKEIFRISRMLSDEAVFQDSFVWTPIYRDIWTRWLNTKGPDIAIVTVLYITAKRGPPKYENDGAVQPFYRWLDDPLSLEDAHNGFWRERVSHELQLLQSIGTACDEGKKGVLWKWRVIGDDPDGLGAFEGEGGERGKMQEVEELAACWHGRGHQCR
ncbi:hypothetical protein EVG20_g6238 [Dentipellis fragilis]|uniref:Uncharacterized protein n=1 Tax=Dentipellis fragilis TaxID=205917 RepID=A0A4Y9YPB6_9AGAM|nr:hypothetical protein EVG20_g6238 [Dentipellis fragilis]